MAFLKAQENLMMITITEVVGFTKLIQKFKTTVQCKIVHAWFYILITIIQKN